MIQAQIRLLKEMPIALPLPEREQIVEEERNTVDEMFARFLAWLAGDAPAMLP